MILASALIRQAQGIAQDLSTYRWTTAEWLDYLNDAQIQIVQLRPDMSVANRSVALVTGWKQAIPADGLRLLAVEANTSGRAIKLISTEKLNAFAPGWRAEKQADIIKHYMVDQRDPTRFSVYPPASSKASVECLFSVMPTRCDTENSPIFADIVTNQILDWMLFRAYSKDDEFADVAEKRSFYHNSFLTALGAKTQTDLAFDATKSQPALIKPGVR